MVRAILVCDMCDFSFVMVTYSLLLYVRRHNSLANHDGYIFCFCFANSRFRSYCSMFSGMQIRSCGRVPPRRVHLLLFLLLLLPRPLVKRLLHVHRLGHRSGAALDRAGSHGPCYLFFLPTDPHLHHIHPLRPRTHDCAVAGTCISPRTNWWPRLLWSSGPILRQVLDGLRNEVCPTFPEHCAARVCEAGPERRRERDAG
jgi:hypothetical protein